MEVHNGPEPRSADHAPEVLQEHSDKIGVFSEQQPPQHYDSQPQQYYHHQPSLAAGSDGYWRETGTSPPYGSAAPGSSPVNYHTHPATPATGTAYMGPPTDTTGDLGAEKGIAPPNGRDRRICGLARSAFFIIVAAVVIIILAIGIGVGVGVGVGNKHHDSNTSAASTPNSTTTTSSAGPVVTTAFETCPDGNGTSYQSPIKSTKFIRYCGVDYSGSDATDLFNILTKTVDECIDNCALVANCSGVGWGYVESVDSGDEMSCYLKADLNSPHSAVSSWNFAVKQD